MGSDEIDLTIPDWMLRKPGPTKPVSDLPSTATPWIMPEVPRREGATTTAQKDALAMLTAKYVRRGADTLGKLRKALEENACRTDTLAKDLRRAIRLGLVAREGKRYYAR